MKRRSFIATAIGAVLGLFWKPAPAAKPKLLDGLVTYWKLDEAPFHGLYGSSWETFIRPNRPCVDCGHPDCHGNDDFPSCEACGESAIGYGLENDVWDFQWYRDADGYDLCPDCAAKPESERWEV